MQKIGKRIAEKQKHKTTKLNWERWKEAILSKDRGQALENLRNLSGIKTAFYLWRDAFLVNTLVAPFVREAENKL